MYFNPRPPRGGRQCNNDWRVCHRRISIHAPREGGDYIFAANNKTGAISIHAPREGGDWAETPNLLTTFIFQSTPPARGATPDHQAGHQHQNISIHAPREGGDADAGKVRVTVAFISIHAPREGGDGFRLDNFDNLYNFNPRPPRGGRRPLLRAS